MLCCLLKAEIFQVIRRFEWQVSFFLSSNLTSNCPEFELLCTVKRHMCVQKKSNTRSSHNITIYVFVKRECVQLSFLYRFLLIFNFLQEKIIKYTRWSSAVVLIHLEDRKKEKKRCTVIKYNDCKWDYYSNYCIKSCWDLKKESFKRKRRQEDA